MFTFSFSSAFAATSYTLDDYATALTAEKTAQLGYMNSAKIQAVNSYKYDEDGFTTEGYMKAAYEAAADEVIADATKLMDDAINTVLNDKDWPKATAADKTIVANAYKATMGDLTTKDGMLAAIAKKADTLNKTQAPLTKTFVEGKLNVDMSKYDTTNKKYEGNTLTAAQAVQKAVDEAKDAIDKAAADKAKTDAEKNTAYKAAYEQFKTAMAKIKTIDDEKYSDGINAGTVEAAVEEYAKNTLDDIATVLAIDPNMAADATKDWSTVATGTLKAFWEANKVTTNKGEFFGVEIANITKVTRTEVAAVAAAYKNAVAAAKAPVKAFANGSKDKVTAITTADARLAVLANATKAVEKYADVKAYGDKMKAAYEFGIKVYDDAKVDAAVKAAEQLVYDDLNKNVYDTKEAKDYINAAATKENLTLTLTNFEAQKFDKAIEDAAKKMYKDGTKATDPQVKVSYGDDKTADADLVYLKGTYDSTAADKWASIAKDAVADLKDAQSYDEITKIMADAATDFGKLLKAADAADVKAARDSYKAALVNYGKLKASLLNNEKDYPTPTINAAVEQGKKLIDKATTVDAVKAAYEEAKAIVDNVKTADELKAAKEAVEKQIAALPYTSKLTEADKAAVKAAYDAYAAYKNMPGATEVSNKALLQEKYNKVNELAAKTIDDKAKALNKQLKTFGPTIKTMSDADKAAMAALKAEADAVKAEAKALNKEIKNVNDDYDGFLNAVSMPEYDKLASEDFAAAVAADALVKLTKAAKEGATVEEMNEALAAYKALTDRQRYEIDETALPLIKVVESKLGAEVKALKITTGSKAKKGSITVSWTVKGNATLADGFQVWKSTKKNSGFKKAITTKKQSYKNTKGLKKGTRYYYKVRAYKVVDGKNVYSDWSNKAIRKAK
ncbi:hypothetical protein [Phascolarctobacterium succinatutens]|uniref:hypothetical protein n=1 Tax=Phascolarctobacterium succinatutens TaxID=626940 RepID=UPI003AF01A68